MLAFAQVAESAVCVGFGQSSSTCVGGTTDYIGNVTGVTFSSGSTPPANRVFVQLFTATCAGSCTTGTLNTASIYETAVAYSADKTVKVCVYSDNGDGVANSGDTLISCSDPITQDTGGNAGWRTNTGLSGTVTCGSNYWVAYTANTVAQPTIGYKVDTITSYYQSITNAFASPPANLGGTWTGVTRNQGVGVDIR